MNWRKINEQYKNTKNARHIDDSCGSGIPVSFRSRFRKMRDTEMTESEFLEKLDGLIKQYRDQCLWFLRKDLLPREPAQILRILGSIEKHADREGFIQARQLRQWLSQNSSAKSAG